MGRRRKPDVGALNESLPVDVLPASNGEFLPKPPSDEQKLIMARADEATEDMRRKFGMNRREFVRTAAAYGVGIWAINQVRDLTWGHYKVSAADESRTNAACDLAYNYPKYLDAADPRWHLAPLEGEFIFDIQSHHVESDGAWRVTNPAMEAFFAAIWSQSGGAAAGTDQPYWLTGNPLDGTFVPFRGGREADPIEDLSRYHYLKELYLDSSTQMCVLSAVPSDPNNQPLPIDRAALTVHTVNHLASSQRCVMHAFVMPNRGSLGSTSSAGKQRPVFQQAEFDAMEQNALLYGPQADGTPGILAGWKTYPAWGDVPYASGWYFDDDLGLAFCQQVLDVSRKYGTPPVIATHKGFALPGFDQRAASPRDIGPAARQFPGVTFIVYHSGYDSGTEGPYPGDDKVNSADRSVNAFVKSLRENRWDAGQFRKPWQSHGNVPNVVAEIGSTWRSVMNDPNQAAHLLGKLITYVGPMRVAWGTDSLWFGSPQSEIIAFRTFQMSDPAKELYNLPYGLDGDAEDPQKNALDGTSYMSAHAHIPDWPTDSKAHPERTIRNAIFGRNAARAYSYGKFKIDPNPLRKAMSCDDVQKIRDSYIVNQATPTESAPFSTNQILGRRTPAGVLKDRANSPWSP
jgi:predicted TIM-barrel fold metal-dependent hydrolase